MKLPIVTALLLLTGSACLPDGPAPAFPLCEATRLERELGCEVLRSESLATCHQHATHPRAGCRADAQDSYGLCLIQLGEQERGDFERCRGSCFFLRDLCNEHVAKIAGSDLDCEQEQVECEDLCSVPSLQQ